MFLTTCPASNDATEAQQNPSQPEDSSFKLPANSRIMRGCHHCCGCCCGLVLQSAASSVRRLLGSSWPGWCSSSTDARAANSPRSALICPLTRQRRVTASWLLPGCSHMLRLSRRHGSDVNVEMLVPSPAAAALYNLSPCFSRLKLL